MKLERRTIPVLFIVLSLVLSAPALAQGPTAPEIGGAKTVGVMQAPAQSLSNSFVRLDVGDDGLFVIGTTGGDPGIALDNDKRLLYGFEPDGASGIWSSYPSVRVVTGETTTDYSMLVVEPSQAPATTGNAITTVWTVATNIRVTQMLSFMVNPFSGREDIVRVEYTVTNQDTVAHSVGVRSMLDVMVGMNDAAPYFVPGVGNSNLEQEFTAANMPPYYYSFESTEFAADSLKGQGLLTGFGMTTPDRFQIVSWAAIYGTQWEYTVDPTETTGDSATVMYWNPVPLAAGQSVTFVTAYGLAGQGGGAAWISAPVLVGAGTTTFTATSWVNNLTTDPFVGGSATITLPAGLRLAPGETATKPLATVAAGDVGQVSWQLEITGGIGAYDYSVTSTFTSGSDPLTATGRIEVVDTLLPVFLPLVIK